MRKQSDFFVSRYVNFQNFLKIIFSNGKILATSNTLSKKKLTKKEKKFLTILIILKYVTIYLEILTEKMSTFFCMKN